VRTSAGVFFPERGAICPASNDAMVDLRNIAEQGRGTNHIIDRIDES
jgi:hypothetical protein